MEKDKKGTAQVLQGQSEGFETKLGDTSIIFGANEIILKAPEIMLQCQ